MAFPSIRSSASGSEANSTAPTFTVGSTVSSGDLILFMGATDATAIFTVPTGYTEIENSTLASLFTSIVFAKIADGTEDGGTIDGILSANESSSFICYVIQDWYGNLSGVEISSGSTSASNSPDPDSLSPSWGAEDTLWIAFCSSDFWDNTALAYPTNYSSNQITQAHVSEFGGTQANSAATRELNSSSEDPSAFTVGGSTQVNAAFTLAIRPSSGAASIVTILMQQTNQFNGGT